MTNNRQSGTWMVCLLLALALLCAVTTHRRFLPFPKPDEHIDAPGKHSVLSQFLPDKARLHLGHNAAAVGSAGVGSAGVAGRPLTLQAATDSTGLSLSRIRASLMQAHVQILEG
ncbi:hypothetical protein BD289DRAFT_451543 [Coniella lustricola]|uniref:Uncharacterized protein n=1 Tax=Coniella lustricola TaxID=2025994 RepID=A0A2T3AE84_9PEZI|nr:hypothetical protein BD289DRAFT_451543 [Coniella lustricola]